MCPIDDQLLGIDPATGHIVPLAAAISQPAKDTVRMTAAPGWEIALLDNVICVTDGDDSFLFAIDVIEGEEIVGVHRGPNYIEVTTRGR